MPRLTKPRTRLRPGDARLLHDLAVLRQALGPKRVPARVRLEERVGADLARALRASLAETTARAA